jgi:hypothetical protein
VEERGGLGAGWPCDKDEKRLGSRLARPDKDLPPKLYSMTGLGGGVGSSEGVDVKLSTRLYVCITNLFFKVPLSRNLISAFNVRDIHRV